MWARPGFSLGFFMWSGFYLAWGSSCGQVLPGLGFFTWSGFYLAWGSSGGLDLGSTWQGICVVTRHDWHMPCVSHDISVHTYCTTRLCKWPFKLESLRHSGPSYPDMIDGWQALWKWIVSSVLGCKSFLGWIVTYWTRLAGPGKLVPLELETILETYQLGFSSSCSYALLQIRR